MSTMQLAFKFEGMVEAYRSCCIDNERRKTMMCVLKLNGDLQEV